MKIFKYVILGAILMALFACENEKNTFSDNPSIYIGGDKEQNATADSVIFSFKKYDDAVQSYDLNLMVYVTGVVSDRARTFALEVLERMFLPTITRWEIWRFRPELIMRRYPLR